MPVIPQDPDQIVQDAAEQKKRRSNRASGNDRTATGDVTPISEEQMLALPTEVVVRGLKMTLVCPVIRDAVTIQTGIFVAVPDVLMIAAVGERGGTGVSVAQVQAGLQAQRKERYAEYVVLCKKENRSPDVWEEISRQDVLDALQAVSYNLLTIIPNLCDTIWPLLSTSPNLRWPRPVPEEVQEPETLPPGVEYLDEAIMSRFTVPGLADLLRVVFSCMGGFPGDAGERFL